MTENQPDDLPEPNGSSEEQCWLYLLGELDASKSAEFEQRLATSPELSDQLLRQAELISGLSTIKHQLQVAPATPSRVSSWSIAVSIMTVAACLAIVVLGVRSRSVEKDSLASRTPSLSPRGIAAKDPNVSEDLLIARAWADSRRSEVSEDFALADLDSDEALPEDEPSDLDSTLSWMFIAVAANPELDDAGDEGAANDG
jgi:hypothetical protein